MQGSWSANSRSSAVAFDWGRLGDLNPGPTHYESGGNTSIRPRLWRFLEASTARESC
jgi:hypothetical protein